MPRLLILFAVTLAVVGCQRADERPAELPRAGMKPILKIGRCDARLGAPATREQEAILKTLEANRAAYAQRWDALTPETNPSEYHKAFGDYLKAMRELDVKETSLEFRGAWTRYLDGWGKFLGELRATPDGLYKNVEFMEALHAAFGAGGKDAVKGLSTDAISAAEKLKETLGKLHTAAEASGVNCHNS